MRTFNLSVFLKVVAAILFGLAAFGIGFGPIAFVPAGLCLLAISFVV